MALSGEFVFQRIEEIHSSGLTNDEKLRNLRIISEETLRSLIKDHGVRISQLSHMAVYLFDKNPEAKKHEDEFFGFLKLANKASHNYPYNCPDDQILAAIKAVSLVFSALLDTPVPESIQLLYSNEKLPLLRLKGLQNKEIVEFVQATIKKVVKKKQGPDAKNYILLFCFSEEMGDFSVIIYENQRNVDNKSKPSKNLFEWGQFIPEYSQVNFFYILQNKERPDQYSLDFTRTMIVLEPDFLLEAKDIGTLFYSAERSPALYIIEKLLPQETNSAMFKGNLVNNLLDEYLYNDNVDFEETYTGFLNENLISATTFKDDLPKVKTEVMTVHLPRIKAELPKLRGAEGEYTVITEPTFYSALFGITGRLDILQSSNTDPKRKNVIELKSGLASSSGVWKSEEMQVTAYNLLMQSTYGFDRLGDSAIFYTKANTNHFRNVPVMAQKSIEYLTGRNEIFLVLNMLRQNDDRLFARLMNFDPPSNNKFAPAKIEKFRKNFSAASPLEQKYYRVCVSFMINELFDSKISSNDNEQTDSSFASLWRQQPAIKEDFQFSLIRGLKFSHHDKEKNSFVFDRTIQKVSKFRENDLIILYPHDEYELEPLKCQILKGTIAELTNEKVAVKLFNKQLDKTVFNSGKYFAIEPDYKDSGIISTVRMMFNFLEADTRKKELLLGLRAPVSGDLPSIDETGMQQSQAENVKKALSAKDYYLLQGPPGTGKTSMALMSMIKAILAGDGEETVTILAFTNKAIKEVCKKLKEAGIDYLFNSASEDDTSSLKTMVKTHNLESFEEYIKGIRVVTSTVASFVRNSKDLSSFFKFDTLIVDEASQLLEPQLAGIIVNFQRFILIGDQNQLPAVTVQGDANTLITDSDLNGAGIRDMKVSLFERMFYTAVAKGWTHAYGTLKEQFRMHEVIMDLINHYYHGNLQCALSGRESLDSIYPNPDDSALSKILTGNRLIFIETQYSKTGKMNESEAEIVSMIAGKIREISGLPKDELPDIGIITPWRAQIAAINQRLEMKGITGLPVDTVERFQGSENKIIIYSTSVSNTSQLERLGSFGKNKSVENEVEVDRKLNVVLSRAQEQLIVLGSVSVLRTSLHYRKLIETIREKGRFVSTTERKKLFGT
ncbi:MAG: DNA2/NAM7 family helicase [Bacteroidetes bacterium]|nr:DNA2/NAM7 family helicase [Bacteroidota bacterium]